MKNFDIVVVGAGILGIAHAYHCLEAGYKVALVERNAYPMDATVRNFGQVVPSGFGSKWQMYGRESLRIYKEFQSKTDLTIRQEGTVYLASDEAEERLINELRAINQKNGYTSHLLTHKECIDKYSGVRPDYVRAGLFFPEEVVVDPRMMAKRLIDYLVSERGLSYFPNTPICQIEKKDKVVMTSKREIQFSADKVFLCCGAEFESLYPQLFAASDIKLVKIQMMETLPQTSVNILGAILTGWTIRRYEAFQECPSYAEIKAKEDAEDYQRVNGVHILFKQSLDGSVIIGDSHHYKSVRDGVRMDYMNDAELNEYMLYEAKKIYQLDTWSLRNVWYGIYSQREDSDIFNETIDGDIHIVTAIGGKGMSGSLGYAQENVQTILSQNTTMI